MMHPTKGGEGGRKIEARQLLSQKSSSNNTHKEQGANGAANTNELDMSGLEPSVDGLLLGPGEGGSEGVTGIVDIVAAVLLLV